MFALFCPPFFPIVTHLPAFIMGRRSVFLPRCCPVRKTAVAHTQVNLFIFFFYFPLSDNHSLPPHPRARSSQPPTSSFGDVLTARKTNETKMISSFLFCFYSQDTYCFFLRLFLVMAVRFTKTGSDPIRSV